MSDPNQEPEAPSDGLGTTSRETSRESITDVCLLIGSDFIAEWKVRAFERMTEEFGARVTLVVRAFGEGEGGSSAEGSSAAVGPVDRAKRYLTRDSKVRRPLSSYEYLMKADWMGCHLRRHNDGGMELPDEAVDKIAAETDVVVQFAVGILKGRVLTAPEYGVLGYHLADVHEYRGANVTLWMFLDGVDEAGVTLQQLTPELDGGRIVAIEPTDLSGARSWREVRSRLYETAETMFVPSLRRLSDPEFTPEPLPPSELGPMYYKSDVTIRTKIRYAFKSARYILENSRSDSR